MEWDVAIVAVYVMLLVGMGLHGGKKVRSAADFVAADGRYGTAVLFASLSASYIGGGYSAGNAEKAFESGIGMTLALFGFSAATLLTGKFLVAGVERFRGQTTVGGVIGQAYGRSARVMTGFFSFLCCAGVVGAQMEGMGRVLHALLGISPTQGVLLGSAIVLVYSTFGGLQSVIAADVVQFVLLCIGLPLLLWCGLREAGGLAEVWSRIPDDYKNPFSNYTGVEFASLFLGMALGEALAPPYTQRLLVGKSARTTARATIWSGWLSIPIFVTTGLIGLTAFVLNVTDEPALAMPALILQTLPTGIRGVIMAAMLSIMLSAADGFLNSAAVSFVCDGLVPLCPRLRDPTRLRLLRAVNVAVGLAGVAVALFADDIMGILMLAYSFWCPLILPPLVAAFLGVRSDGRSFRRALLIGLGVTVIWEWGLGCPAGLSGAIVGTAANALTFTAETVRSRFSRRPKISASPPHKPPVRPTLPR